MNTQKMIRYIIGAYTAREPLSIDQLYTRCTGTKNASIFFKAFAELLAAGRLEKIQNECYRLKQ
jgi:hypothetical protein